ncbi:unnamed protein product [Rhizophagus irregularis]|nr:unnamed protein product [Rhizophagus irregularis]
MTEQVQRLNEESEQSFEMEKRDEAHTSQVVHIVVFGNIWIECESKGDGHWEGTCQYWKNSTHVPNQTFCVATSC